MRIKTEKREEKTSFEVMDILFCGMKASSEELHF
jgi:hypothetical protein